MPTEAVLRLTEEERRAEEREAAARAEAEKTVKDAALRADDILAGARKRAAEMEKDALRRAEADFSNMSGGRSDSSHGGNDHILAAAVRIIKEEILK